MPEPLGESWRTIALRPRCRRSPVIVQMSPSRSPGSLSGKIDSLHVRRLACLRRARRIRAAAAARGGRGSPTRRAPAMVRAAAGTRRGPSRAVGRVLSRPKPAANLVGTARGSPPGLLAPGDASGPCRSASEERLRRTRMYGTLALSHRALDDLADVAGERDDRRAAHARAPDRRAARAQPQRHGLRHGHGRAAELVGAAAHRPGPRLPLAGRARVRRRRARRPRHVPGARRHLRRLDAGDDRHVAALRRDERRTADRAVRRHHRARPAAAGDALVRARRIRARSG